jgi:hypothetical protein
MHYQEQSRLLLPPLAAKLLAAKLLGMERVFKSHQ